MYKFKTVSSTSILFALALAMVGNTQVSKAAEPIEAPFEDSLKGRYAVVIAEKNSNGADNADKVSFKIKKALWDPRKQADTNDDVVVSNFSHLNNSINNPKKHQLDCRIMVISKFQKHRLFRDEIIDNPEGMSVQVLPAVGPGIFNCSDEIISIYSKIIDGGEYPRPPMLHDLLTLAESDDEQSRRLASFELSMHGDWMAQANAKNVAHLRRVMNGESLPAEANEMLIRAARGLPESHYQDWFRDYLLGILEENPSPYDLGSFTPLLVRNSILTMKDLSLTEASDWNTLMPFLYSNAPGVAKAAIRALDAIDAERFRNDSQALLSDNSKVAQLHTETRRALEAHLRQTAVL